MLRRFPLKTEPQRCCDTGAEFEGEVAIAQMGRLSGLLANTDGKARAQFRFGKSEDGVRILEGSIQASVAQVCQRCMKPVKVEVNSDIRLGLVESDYEATRLPDAIEPLLMEEGMISLAEVVEDELLLSLPVVARHEAGECEAPESVDAVAENEIQEKKPNPFAVLADLKRN